MAMTRICDRCRKPAEGDNSLDLTLGNDEHHIEAAWDLCANCADKIAKTVRHRFITATTDPNTYTDTEE
jgi:hypothetical protein